MSYAFPILGVPYGGNISEFNTVESNMRRRRAEVQVLKLLDVCIERCTDLDKLNKIMGFRFRLEPISETPTAASKNIAGFKSN